MYQVESDDDAGRQVAALPEDALLGILADEQGAGATVLTDRGITRRRARGWINQALAR